MKRFLISSIIFSVLILIAGACAPAATVTSEPIETPSPTTVPTPTAVRPTNTPENTPVPVKKYSCPISIDSERMTSLSLKEDVQSGELAKWVESLPGFKAPILSNPEKINFLSNKLQKGAITDLGAESIEKPGWETLHSKVLGVCKINPSEFGITGKNDAFVIISVVQDKDNRRMPQFTLTGKQGLLELFSQGYLTSPSSGINPRDILNSTSNVVLILDGAKPSGPDDLRGLDDENVFYGEQSQDTSFGDKKGLKAVDAVFDTIAANDIFSPEIVHFFGTNLFFTSEYSQIY